MLGDVVTVVRVSICVIYVTIPGPGPGLPPNSLWTLSQYVTHTLQNIRFYDFISTSTTVFVLESASLRLLSQNPSILLYSF